LDGTLTGRLLSEDLLPESLAVQSGHPMDSSRLLLGLMTFSGKAGAADDESSADALEGVISTAVLRSLLSALHFRDVATVCHSRQTAHLAIGMASFLGWDPAQQKRLEIAALLHDIGKIGVPDSVLFKPGKLSPEESELMALHHNIAVDVLQACRVDNEVLQIIVQSHSRYKDGTNGNRRIRGEVHQGARILAVADAYDSLSTEQAYRGGMSHEEIMKVLMDSAGSRYDGNVICALSRWIESEGPPASKHAGDLMEASGPQRPIHTEEALEASWIGNIFSYLYVLESLYDGFYLVDSDLRFVIWNQGAERVLDQPASAMLGQLWSSRILGYAGQDGLELPEKQCPMHRVVTDGKPTTSTLQLTRKDGKAVNVEMQSVPILDKEGRLHGVAEILRDPTRSHRRPHEYRELTMAARHDPLTSVANRGELETQLALLLSELLERGDSDPFSLIFIDIDFFKKINDTFGHTVGDRVLIDAARLLQSETYSGELVARYGGEEFVILCPGTPLEQSCRRADRLRIALSQSNVGGMDDCKLTASFGVTEAEPGDSVESILRRADKALYLAKETGRNKTCSLTNAELMESDSKQQDAKETPTDPFVFTGTFSACVQSDMIVYKLGGFVTDQKANLVEVTPKRVVIRVGRRGLLPFWGNSDEKRPVELIVEFDDDPSDQGRQAATKRSKISICIRPVGSVKDADEFQARAKRLWKLLRSFFAAE
jgi:diguanylate cyclase (GGDEF)-like protein/putative nucleotidyltransferase with HDIG domain